MPTGTIYTAVSNLINSKFPLPNPLLRSCPTAVAHTRILDVILDPSRCCHVYCDLPHKEPSTNPSPVIQTQAGVHRTKPAMTLGTPLPNAPVELSLLCLPVFAICSRSRHQMFKKHFGRKTKLANLAANLVFSGLRMGSRFLRPNISSQWCLSCGSCPFAHPQPPHPSKESSRTF